MAIVTAKSSKYIPGLDGLRAISVALVIVAHSEVQKVPGSLGVTVFFFISGFLITGLLLNEQVKSGNISVKNFYARRYFRLMPELFFYVLVASICQYLFANEYRSYDLIAALFYFTNYLDIFNPPKGFHPFPFAHLWSLAVEEHFYLTWPLLIFVARGRKNWVFALCFALIAFGLVDRIVALRLDIGDHYTRYASDSRIDSIAFGCLLAAAIHFKSSSVEWVRRWPKLSVMAGIGLVFAFTFGGLIGLRDDYHEALVYDGQGAGLLLIFTVLYATNASATVMKVLEWAPLRTAGRVSYGMYLWHFCLIYLITMAFRHTDPRELTARESLTCALGALVGSYALGYASAELILKPFGTIRRRFGSHALNRSDL